MTPAGTISTDRLDLVLLDAGVLTALVDSRREDAGRALGAAVPRDWPDAHDAGFLALRLNQLRREPAAAEWLVRALVLRDEETMVGHAGYHGPPGVNGPGARDAVEIGYTVFPAHRGRGYATEAAAALVRNARERGVPRVVASVAPGNEPSLAIVRKLGFVQTGEQWDDEDGLELVFEKRA